ncbi:MAG: fused DSP-PTPase phosphatase/NAD kinase-like protein [Alphaproteobacteria bacterium]
MTRAKFDLSAPRGRIRAYWDMVMVDHGIFRLIWTNGARVSAKLRRSNHPMPYRIGWLKRRGIQTIVNLRGRNDSGWYVLEAEACRKHGIELVDFPTKSRDTPAKEMIHGAKRLFDTIRYPALMHCKSGADRAGLMGVLYRLLHEGRPIEEALEQLHWRYGHIRQAKVGIIDYFFEQYRAYDAKTPTPFLDWVDTIYDPKSVKDSFMTQWWANLVVDKILRRE